MVKTIEFKGQQYPHFQSEGFAAKFAFPYAKQVCKGEGLDIGCGKVEWAFPFSKPIDFTVEDEWHATNLPGQEFDYIFSSHCLEHVNEWVHTLDYWYDHIKKGGVLFLYLPHPSQQYWLPWHNRKHLHVFTPEIIQQYMIDKGYKNIFVSGVDLNNSFMIFGEK